MKTALAILLGSALGYLLFGWNAPPAAADHGLPNHWPTTTVAVNGGSCTMPCRWIRVVDKTGRGSTWRNDHLKPGLHKFRQGVSASAFQYTYFVGSAATCGSAASCQPYLDQTAIGTLAVVNWTGGSAGTVIFETCAENGVQPYCGSDPDHVTRGLLLLAGPQGTAGWWLVWHEAGHILGGLADTGALPGCGVGGVDIMCGSEHTFWNAHSKSLLNAKYGHTDFAALTEGVTPSSQVAIGDPGRKASPSVSADIIPRWLVCNTIHDCHNPPPRPLYSALPHCSEANEGAVELEYDERLGAYVPWECVCTAEFGCKWIRRPLEHRAIIPWDTYRYRWVKDARRSCRSIVCKTEWVRKLYPTKRKFF